MTNARELPRTCPCCGILLARCGAPHACTREQVERLFAGKGPELRELFDALWSAVSELGPAQMIARHDRIVFRGRVRFADVAPRNHWLDGVLWLAHRCEHPRFRLIESIAARVYGHHFRLLSTADLDDEFRSLLADAYAHELGARSESGAGEA